MAEVGNIISREKIHDLVAVFYQPTFKTFYVNSQDGINTCKPIGVFVSLGITTSMGVLENIRSIIEGNKEYKATLVEISSKRENGQFINTISSLNPEQYRLSDPCPDLMDRDAALKELEEIKGLMNVDTDLETLKTMAPRVSRLKYLIDRLDESKSWDAHKIQKEPDQGYRIYHMYVNYEKRDNLEYRIGILVNGKENTDQVD
jgi:hypothetical protein